MENTIYNPAYREEISITIDTEDGVKDCFIVATPKSKYGEYIALLPKDKNIKSGKMLVYKVLKGEDNIPNLVGIEDDAEYDYAYEILTEILPDHEYYELIEKYKDAFDN